MGKKSPDDREMKTAKQNKRLKSSSGKYLRPGTIAHLRYNKASAAKLCTDLGKERVAVLDTKKLADGNLLMENKVIEKSPLMSSPVVFHKQNSMAWTPKIPRPEVFESESRLESLHMDLLVKILCHLHHDQLRAVFHVSQRIRKAVCLARQFHLNYTTPDRSRQEMLSIMTPRPTEHWPFTRGEGKGILIKSPHTPKAPRHGPRPPSRVKVTELRQIAAVLFQDSGFPTRCMVPSVLPKPLCKSLASNRVLFYEDELCQAVAQNKLR
ncbi:F-box protein At4g35930-like isoform X2 [Hibiscus syriacus]|uniref:F-box protein At4g35930-like isoform X2 n=1 Tax=Hibiscus syriacus TaxID=106335 RepID=UPI0019229D41|nr:F-box protein At4g35930-like isoform X2 [Hibiscus syriacus]